MSLVDQSQQWYPTSVRVTVHQAKDLRAKGKNGTSDAYAIIQVAKDKFSTSVAEKCVAPVWKEEASFDLPLFHPGNAERCTLYIIVMHRAQVGLDKFLGQAVINLLELHDNKDRKRTDWFKLVDKTGKEDKARGEVLLDLQFMRNNMSASMFDLSMQDKPRSRISKLKDKVRGKKKDSFSDSASAIVPSVSQVLTDSEGEADTVSISSEGTKKKSKLKTLFAPKTNLHRNVSQSMSTLGTLPEKNSSLSSSRSSGLNVESPDVKKKFKFLGHKRTGSSDSRVSQGPFSLLGRSKQNDSNNLCINGSHVYTEEAEAKGGSTLSLNSSGHGSVEDVRKQTFDIPAATNPFISVTPPSSSQSNDRALLEQQQRHQEEQRRIAEAKRLEEEKRAEALRLQQEQQRLHQEELDRQRRILEDEARRKKQREEEEMRRRQEEERRMKEENEKREEELRQQALEQKRQEEASMSDRLTSLFGMIRKKEEKKEDVAPEVKQEPPAPSLHSQSEDKHIAVSHQASNPFEEISLSSDHLVSSNESPTESKSGRNPPIPSAMVFLNRTAKVKPRLTETLKADPTDQGPYPAAPDTTPSSPAPSEPSDHFETLHSLLAPQSKGLSDSPGDSTEILSSEETSETMADTKRRAPLPSSYLVNGTHMGGREILNPAYVEPEAPQQNQKMSIPLPDYETLFPQKRHGVQGQTRWDHIIAEVNQKHRDSSVELSGKEMSVDGPEEHHANPSRSSSTVQQYRTQTPSPKPVSTKSVAAPDPPKPVGPSEYRSQVETKQSQNSSQACSSVVNTDLPPPQKPARTDRTTVESSRKALQPPSSLSQASRPKSQIDTDISPRSSQRNLQSSVHKEAPTAKPRQKASSNEPETVVAPHRNTASNVTERNNRNTVENTTQFDPFPNNELLSKDPWTQQTKQYQDVDNLFTGNFPTEKKPEEQGMTADDFDNIFSITPDHFAAANGSHEESKKSLAPNHKTEVKTRRYNDREDPFKSDPFTTSSEPLPVVMEELETGGLAGGKTTPLQAWVSPSEVQPVSTQNSSGGGLALTQRRPHPVKPLSSADSQQPPVIKGIKVHDSAPAKYKVSGSPQSGPYTQLTQEELITMVVKQQADLSKKDAKIVELEEYIDNLLVRVIEEKPSILHALDAPKPL